MKKILFIFLLITGFTISATSITDAVVAYDMENLINGNLEDISGNGYSSNGLGGAVLVDGKDGKALAFDGTDQVRISHNSAFQVTNNFTLEASVYITARASDWVRVVGKGPSGNRSYGLWYHPLSNRFLFQIYDPTSGSWINAFYDATVNLNTWYHMVGVYDGSYIHLYLNGTEVSSTAHDDYIPAPETEDLTIGGADFHTLHYGYIDNVALYNFILPEEDISLHGLEGIAPIPEPNIIILMLIGVFIFMKSCKKII